VPPDVGKNGWIGEWLDTRSLDWSVLNHVIEESDGLTAGRAQRRSRRQ
jgi:hypothetical protein